jgi:RNA polymerase sigma-70 factor (ECF subfamily)
VTQHDPRQPSIDETVEQYHRPLVSYAWRMLGDLEQARDVVQDAFLRLWQQTRGGRPVQQVKPWLYTTCRHAALDLLRRSKAMTIHADDTLSQSEAPTAPPMAAMEHAETCNHLVAAMQHLSPAQREVLVLRFQQDLSYQDIATVTGHSVGYVGSLIHDGLKRLRRHMTEPRESSTRG